MISKSVGLPYKAKYCLPSNLFFLVFKLPVGENLHSSQALLFGDFPATVTPSKLYAHFKFNVNPKNRNFKKILDLKVYGNLDSSVR